MATRKKAPKPTRHYLTISMQAEAELNAGPYGKVVGFVRWPIKVTSDEAMRILCGLAPDDLNNVLREAEVEIAWETDSPPASLPHTSPPPWAWPLR